MFCFVCFFSHQKQFLIFLVNDNSTAFHHIFGLFCVLNVLEDSLVLGLILLLKYYVKIIAWLKMTYYIHKSYFDSCLIDKHVYWLKKEKSIRGKTVNIDILPFGSHIRHLSEEALLANTVICTVRIHPFRPLVMNM